MVLRKSLLPLVLLSTTFTAAQVAYNPTTQTFTCPPTGGTFCLAASLSSAIIIRCKGDVGVEGNCNSDLKGLPPQGTKLTAACYEPSPQSGTAACSFQGTIYPDAGEPFPLFSSSSVSFTTSSTASTSTTSTTSTSSTFSSSSSSLTPSTTLAQPPTTAPPTTTTGTSNGASPLPKGLAESFTPSSGVIGMGTLTASTVSSTAGAVAWTMATGGAKMGTMGMGVGVGLLGAWVGW